MIAKENDEKPFDLEAGFSIDLPLHRVQYIPAGRCLIVSFEHAGLSVRGDKNRLPWSSHFFLKEGHSVLGVVAHKSIWFRDAALHQALTDLKTRGFFKLFDSVVLTGGSMGGFGAAAFASLSPDCIVLAFNPQSTLDKRKVPWEDRYERPSKENWDLPFGDAALEAVHASKVYVVYDPFFKLDANHALRFPEENRILLPVPFIGHGVPSTLQEIRILADISRKAIASTLTREEFSVLARKRKKSPKYYKTLIQSLTMRKHYASAISLCRKAYKMFNDPVFQEMRAVVLAAEGRTEAAFELIQMDQQARGKSIRQARRAKKIAKGRETVAKGPAADG